MTGIARHQITLSDLTKTQRDVLAGLSRRPLYRARNGWRRPGEFNRVSITTGNALLKLGLAMNAAGRMELTESGKNLVNELGDPRAKRRART